MSILQCKGKRQEAMSPYAAIIVPSPIGESFMTFAQKALSSWNADKQEAYRKAHPSDGIVLHIVLDASPSMHGRNAENLRKAYAMYLAWLRRHADPMSLAEVSTFATTLKRQSVTPLGACQPLTSQTYDPLEEAGTALYAAVGQVCTSPQGIGQHVLVVFTDGLDNCSDEVGWSAETVAQILATLQAQDGWLCVFLGAGIDALVIGQAMGFTSGNCLAFPTDQIPEAFERLTKATAPYLLATPAERKRLAAGGIF
jgi:hypothetical protein